MHPAQHRPLLRAAVSAASSLALISTADAQLFTALTPAESGVDASFAFSPLYQGPERMAGSVSIGDFNGDGWPDLFLPSDSIRGDLLYLNDQDGTFTEVSAAWGLGEIHAGLCSAVGDYDNDGDLDVFVASMGEPGAVAPGGNRLYRNDGGTFTNVAALAGVTTASGQSPDGFGASFADVDMDGDLDLFMAGWMPTHQGNRLFRNDDGIFTDVTTEWFGDFFDNNLTHGFSPRFVDMDGDLDPELLLAADFGTSRYFRHDGDSYTCLTPVNGTGLDSNGMGNAVGDIDRDGMLDWYVTSIFYADERTGRFNGNKLYMNKGGHAYSEESMQRGCRDGAWGWGAAAQDFNHDGIVDLTNANGWFDPDFTDGAKLFICEPGTIFSESGVVEGLTVVGEGRSLATVDFDRDMDLDIVIVGPGEPVRLFRNNMRSPDGAHAPDSNAVRLVFDTSAVDDLPPNGFGVRAELTPPTGPVLVRYLDGGAGYIGTSEHALHFGVSRVETITGLRFRWPNGDVTTIPDVAANQELTIVAGGGPGDLDANGVTDADDLATLLAYWGTSHPGADINEDGVIGAGDLAELLSGWGGQ